MWSSNCSDNSIFIQEFDFIRVPDQFISFPITDAITLNKWQKLGQNKVKKQENISQTSAILYGSPFS